LRVTSWLKNVFVFVPAVFSKHFFDKSYFIEAVMAFVAFSMASSFVYVFNDLADVEKDKIHPLKRKRPLASGRIPKSRAVLLMVALLFATILFSLKFEKSFVILLWTYIVLNFFYTIWLKEVVIVDIFCIAFGFMLRVFSGAFAVDVYLNGLFFTTILFALFGIRKGE
jgi:4-hydroxybenzoate polyprenyltransferase